MKKESRQRKKDTVQHQLRVGFRRNMRPVLAIRPYHFQTLLLNLTAKEAIPRPKNPA